MSKIEVLLILEIIGVTPSGNFEVNVVCKSSLQYVVFSAIIFLENIGANKVSPKTDPIASSRLSMSLIVFSKEFLSKVSCPSKDDRELNSALALLRFEFA